MLLRSFMVILLTAGVLAAVVPDSQDPVTSNAIISPMVEEYSFEPIYIYVPLHIQDAGLD